VSLNADKHFAIIDYSSASCAAEALKTVAVKHDGSIMKVEARRRGAAKPKGGGKGNSDLSSGGRGSGQGGKGGGRGDSRKGGSSQRKPRVSVEDK